MLPDVGMVKVYPKCVVKAANVDWVVTLTRNTPCSWTFSTELALVVFLGAILFSFHNFVVWLHVTEIYICIYILL